MAEVVALTPKAKEAVVQVWACACGCTTHYHHATGEVECANCGNIASGAHGGWRENFPEPDDEPQACDTTNFKHVDLGSPMMALKRFAKSLKLGESKAAISVDKDGCLSTWGDATPEQMPWLRERLNAAVARLMGDARG